MRTYGPRRRIALVILVLVLLGSSLALTGCQMAASKTDRASMDWSRGERLGQAAVNDSVALAVSPEGDDAYLVWVARDEADEAESLHFARLDASGSVLSDRRLAVGVDRPTEVRLTRDGQGHLHLTWTAQLASVRRLFHARIEPSGQVVSYPRPISPEGAAVNSYATALHADGLIDIVWSVDDGPGKGLYHRRLDTWGDGVGTTSRLRDAGYDPALLPDDQGRLHMAWQDEPSIGEQSIYYALVDVAGGALTQERRLTSFPSPIGVVARRPSIGGAGDEVYIFWSRERRGGGLTPPSAESYYTVLPTGQPEQAIEPVRVAIPSLNYPELERVTTSYAVSELARPGQAPFPSQFVYLPATVGGQRNELVAAFAVELSGRTKSVIQIVATVWSDGQLQGYQVAGKTRNSSLKPSIAVDNRGDLHLAWIDTAGFGTYDVYYASTAQAVRSRLNRITAADIAAALFDLLWALVQGLSFLPMALAWLFIPLAAVSIYLFVSAEGDLARRGPRIMLVVAMVLYVAFKYLFRPTWLAALPLPRRTPLEVSNTLIYLAPLLVSGLAGLITWLYVKKRAYASLLATFVLFAGSDALLTLLLYVPGVLRE